MNQKFLDSLSGHIYIVNCLHRNWFWRLIGHTALLIRHVDNWWIYESTSRGEKSGVQSHLALYWDYPGAVYLRQVMVDDPEKVVRGIMSNQLALEEARTPYVAIDTFSGRLKLYFSTLDFNVFGRDIFFYRGQDKGVYCTELVVTHGQMTGWIKQMYDCKVVFAHEFEPDDMRNGKIEKYMNCKLGPEFEVTK